MNRREFAVATAAVAAGAAITSQPEPRDIRWLYVSDDPKPEIERLYADAMPPLTLTERLEHDKGEYRSAAEMHAKWQELVIRRGEEDANQRLLSAKAALAAMGLV